MTDRLGGTTDGLSWWEAMGSQPLLGIKLFGEAVERSVPDIEGDVARLIAAALSLELYGRAPDYLVVEISGTSSALVNGGVEVVYTRDCAIVVAPEVGVGTPGALTMDLRAGWEMRGTVPAVGATTANAEGFAYSLEVTSGYGAATYTNPFGLGDLGSLVDAGGIEVGASLPKGALSASADVSWGYALPIPGGTTWRF